MSVLRFYSFMKFSEVLNNLQAVSKILLQYHNTVMKWKYLSPV